MYRDKAYFREFLRDLTDIEKEGLKEVLDDIGITSEDLSWRVAELQRELESAECEIDLLNDQLNG